MSAPAARRILMVAPLAPWPVNSGSKVRMFHLARLLGTRHRVTLVAPSSADDARLQAALPGVELRLVSAVSRSGRGRRLARILTGRVPLHVAEAWSPQMASTIVEASRTPFDVLHVFHLTMAQYAGAARARFSVYDPMGNETLYMERLVRTASAYAVPLLRLNLRRVRRYEAESVSRFDAVVSVSDLEAPHFRGLARPGAQVVTIPIAPDTTPLLSLDAPAGARAVVLFTGSLDWFPNIDAARFLAREIWPDVRRAVPHAELWLAGKDPVPDVVRLACDGIRVIANPASMLPLLREAAVVVAPIRTGSGTKIKTIEAMAAGKAVVASSLGCEGWDVQDDVHLRRIDEPRGFAAAVSALLLDPAERLRLGQAARALVRRRYMVEQMVSDFERLYESGLRTAGAA